jgi:Rieske Fe-S protein
MRRLAIALAAASFAVACPKPEAGTSPASPTPNTAPAEGPSSQPASGATGEADHEEHEKHAGVDRETVDPDGVIRRGNPLSPDLEATPVSVAVARAKELDGKKVKLTGKVTDVCTKMGCWFVVQGDKPEDKIRISTKAHNIFVPRSSVGMTATVEGTLAVKVLDAKTAQHFEDERELKEGEMRKTITTDVNELAIDVVGLEMKKAG